MRLGQIPGKEKSSRVTLSLFFFSLLAAASLGEKAFSVCRYPTHITGLLKRVMLSQVCTVAA